MHRRAPANRQRRRARRGSQRRPGDCLSSQITVTDRCRRVLVSLPLDKKGNGVAYGDENRIDRGGGYRADQDVVAMVKVGSLVRRQHAPRL